MGRKSKVLDKKVTPKFAIRYFYNREQYVLAKDTTKNRFSFYPIDQIYQDENYKIVTVPITVAEKTAKTFDLNAEDYLGYDTSVEKVDSRYLVQSGYLKEHVK